MMNRHSVVYAFWTLWIISCLCFNFQPCFGEGNEENIWKFDYRDVFYDIAYLNKDKAIIVGSRGRVLLSHETYANLWQVKDTGIRMLLTSVSFVDENNGWAAGHGGLIIHTNDGGRTWHIQRQASSENPPLLDITFVSPLIGYSCGAYDTFLKTTDGGKTWNPVPTGMDTIYNGLYFFDQNNGYMAGEFGTILKTRDGGEKWEQMPMDDYQGSFFGITGLTDRIILVYGISGKIMRSTDSGETWKDIPTGTKRPLFDASFKGNDVVVVGQSGTILISRDKGLNFSPENASDMTTFAGVCPHPGGGFVCIGEKGKITHIR